MVRFVPISVEGNAKQQIAALRFNGFGSLYYFTKIILRRKRLTERLHLPICRSLERSHVKDVYEMPRDHFKSTICSEALPIWWALPFGEEDANIFLKAGYPDEYIHHMYRVHNPNIRTLLVSENLTNATKLGSRIGYHFGSNDIYRASYPETLPTSSETWSAHSLHVHRPTSGTGAAHGEGTFDFLGVGGALQSRHYDRVVEDDLVGRKAVESVAIMEKTIDYHRLLVGAFEVDDKDHDNPELIVGNRWGFNDLNSWVFENEPWFAIVNHGALGGCCPEHPADVPIFPEEFSYEKLMRIKQRLGSYHFSCQFLNNPVSPEDADFKVEWLNYFTLREDQNGNAMIVHEVNRDGIVWKDTKIAALTLAMVSDPNHAGNAAHGRCRHAIGILGMSEEGNYYLLDYWVDHGSYDTYIGKLYEIAKKWKQRRLGLETVAAQKYLAYHLNFRNRLEGRDLKIVELKGEVDAPDGTTTRKKEWRIRNVLSPLFESGRFFIQRRHQEFVGEYQTFPRGKYCDLLDALAYAPQLLKVPVRAEQYAMMYAANRRRLNELGKPYSGYAN